MDFNSTPLTPHPPSPTHLSLLLPHLVYKGIQRYIQRNGVDIRIRIRAFNPFQTGMSSAGVRYATNLVRICSVIRVHFPLEVQVPKIWKSYNCLKDFLNET